MTIPAVDAEVAVLGPVLDGVWQGAVRETLEDQRENLEEDGPWEEVTIAILLALELRLTRWWLLSEGLVRESARHLLQSGALEHDGEGSLPTKLEVDKATAGLRWMLDRQRERVREALAAGKMTAEEAQDALTGIRLPGTDTADPWAVMVYSDGSTLEAERRGIRTLYAWATLDARTTPFCRSIHGRAIKVQDLLESKRAWEDAVHRKDWPAASRSRPFVTGNGPLASGKALKTPPPYHQKCRTRLRSQKPPSPSGSPRPR